MQVQSSGHQLLGKQGLMAPLHDLGSKQHLFSAGHIFARLRSRVEMPVSIMSPLQQIGRIVHKNLQPAYHICPSICPTHVAGGRCQSFEWKKPQQLDMSGHLS